MPKSTLPQTHVCTCRATLPGEGGECRCRTAPQVVRRGRRGGAGRLCGDCQAGRHRAMKKRRPAT